MEEELGRVERRGRPKTENPDQGNLIEEGEIPDNYPELSGQESREIAAKKAGFGSEFTYRQAKTVTENATPGYWPPSNRSHPPPRSLTAATFGCDSTIVESDGRTHHSRLPTAATL